MNNFGNWLQEGTPSGFSPSPQVGPAFGSALNKISKNMNQMPFDVIFAGSEAIKVRFGLNDVELDALSKSGVLQRVQGGFRLDRSKFQQAKASLFKQGYRF